MHSVSGSGLLCRVLTIHIKMTKGAERFSKLVPPKEKQPVINIQRHPCFRVRSQYLLPTVVLLDLLRVVSEFFEALA
ncbi:MAG TPA: hypothetical protein PKZ37_17045, partial [Gallionellaceae bacterium]|nr:hypothetical protein [Gallionellaceae bacterium]